MNTLQINVQKTKPVEVKTDLLVVGAYEGEKRLTGIAADIDKVLGGIVADLIKDRSFEGKKNETLIVQTHGRLPAKNILVLGFGKKKSVTDHDIRESAAFVVKEASKGKFKNIAIVGNSNTRSAAAIKKGSSLIAEGLLLGSYTYDQFHNDKKKAEAKKNNVEEIILLANSTVEAKSLQEGINEGRLKAEAVNFARDLVNTPAADMTPSHLVEVAKNIAKQNAKVSVEVFDEVEAKKIGMGAFVGVAKGSDEASYFIHLTYKPAKKAKKKIFLCGKGITFDTGGISLKPASALEQWPMLSDMAGAAVILGVFSKISELKLNVEVHAALPCTENMPSGKALKPHDIVRALNGKTIEVINTDAEGRLVLSDALSFAVKNKADEIVDLATLTGACVLALGSDYAGLFSNNEKITKKIENAAKSSGEKVWAMPMPEEYKRGIKSPVADVKNIGPRMDADAITAALFLQEFVDTTPWVHLDIAGPAWVDNPYRPSSSSRGTGFGVRLLMDYVKAQ